MDRTTGEVIAMTALLEERESFGEDSPLDALAAAIDRFDLDARDTPGAVLGAELIGLARQRRRLDAIWLARIRAFEHSGHAEIDGARDSASWLAHHTSSERRQLASDVHLARNLDRMPATETALRHGDVSAAHARAIAQAVAVDGFDQAEPSFVTTAASASPKATGRAVQEWKAMRTDPKLKTEAEDRLHLSESLDGKWFLNGHHRPEAGALIRRALDDLVAKMGPDPDGARPPLSAKRAAALEMLCERYLRGGTGRPRHRPHLVVHISYDVLAGLTAGHGTIEDGTVVTADTVRRMASDANISRVLTDPAGLPLDVGRTKRTAPHWIRTALVARDGLTCTVPGCDIPVEFCDVCHVGPGWLHGVRTSIDTTAHGCRRHHLQEQAGTICLTMRDGRPRWTHPDGTPLGQPRLDADTSAPGTSGPDPPDTG